MKRFAVAVQTSKTANSAVLVYLAVLLIVGQGQATESTKEKVILPGDELLIDFPSHPELSGVFVVDVRGFLIVPPTSPCLVGGLSLVEGVKSLEANLSEFYQQLSGMEIRVLRHQLAVRVEGRVAQPGDYYLPYFGGVEEALRAAGGIVEGGLLTRVMIQRGESVIEADLREYRISGRRENLPALESGDRVFVPVSNRNAPVMAALAPLELPFEDPNIIHVIGIVPNGGSHQMPGSLSLFEALSLGGGPGVGSDTKHIKVIPPGSPAFEVDLDAYTGPDSEQVPVITAGTTIFVPEKKAGFLSKALSVSAQVLLSAIIVKGVNR